MTRPVPSHFFRQAGVVPYRHRAGRAEVLLVTSLRRGRWIIPKGVVDPGETPLEAARREGHEEAGVGGTLVAEPIGTYDVAKWGGRVHVEVFLLAVQTVVDTWPEADRRRRRWFPVAAAADRLRPAKLRELVRSLEGRLDANEA